MFFMLNNIKKYKNAVLIIIICFGNAFLAIAFFLFMEKNKTAVEFKSFNLFLFHL